MLWLLTCDFKGLVDRKTPSHKYHLPPDSGERKWWRSPLVPKPPSSAWSSSQKTNNPQSSMATQRRFQHFQESKDQNRKAQLLILFCHSQKKNRLCRGHSLFPLLQKKNNNNLTSLLRFMSSGRTLTSQTGQRFCLLNQLGFFLQGHAHEKLFFLFLVHHQILHPQWAWKVNNSDLAWLCSLPLSHCSVNTQGLYRRPAEVRRVNKSEAPHQLVALGWRLKVCREAWCENQGGGTLSDLTWTLWLKVVLKYSSAKYILISKFDRQQAYSKSPQARLFNCIYMLNV